MQTIFDCYCWTFDILITRFWRNAIRWEKVSVVARDVCTESKSLSHWVSNVNDCWATFKHPLKAQLLTHISAAVRLNSSPHFYRFIVRSAWFDVRLTLMNETTLSGFWFIDSMSVRVWDNEWNYLLVLSRPACTFNNVVANSYIIICS